MRNRIRLALSRWLCARLGGHALGIVPVWRDGKARLVCGYGCGYETSGIEVPKQSPVVPPVVRVRRLRVFSNGRWM